MVCSIPRFHDVRREPTLDCEVVPHLDDNTQLSVERYQDRLYASIESKRERMKKRRQVEEEGPDVATPTPADATPMSERAKSADVTPTEIKKVNAVIIYDVIITSLDVNALSLMS